MLTLRKSEVSAEFIMLVGFILLIFIFILVTTSSKTAEVTETTIYSDAQKIADFIANEINFAASIRGYYRNFDLNPKLTNDIEYDVSINTDLRFVEVKWDNKSVISNIITENISGTINPIVTNKIKNDEGMVIIES